ncbi:redox-sensitive transcriptional activator SoxR [Nesterenkonia xinjiangensis]|uniref:MerR family redox-sensitive transcriptional activator SoxR n=1 Tax=Nesterenkonia xinjiangensis TaxID=225327 RepID=A0A7Z0KBG4_9MICC|nr:redox-sensitive transcriptional activator SoxR [Nesterenkonia xinjiangensis]NYJ77572.1 MerR family redox-sensitive transcriptional activator SoxR [Nesterenkonia xinjiangensis]
MPQVHEDIIWLKPGQVAARAGVAVSALHYYESLGLIRSRRTGGNRREYRRETLRVLAFIRASQRVGISLDRIKEALDKLPEQGLPTKKDWSRISREWRDDLNDRIEHLTALRDRFSNCIGCGCLSLESCPYSNPDDVLGAGGPGAQRLLRSPRPAVSTDSSSAAAGEPRRRT